MGRARRWFVHSPFSALSRSLNRKSSRESALKARPESPTVHAVHRLDKVRLTALIVDPHSSAPALSQAVTGALLLAKSPAIATRLVQQLQRHEIQKMYLAVVHGQLRPGFEGDIRGHLRMDLERVRVCGDDEGVEAHTQWQCISSSVRTCLRSALALADASSLIQPRFSLLQLRPMTGRKHQLRVHCSDVLKGECRRA